MRIQTLVGTALATVALAGPISSQAVVETYTGWDGEIGYHPFGLIPNATDAYGQTFTAPAQYLNSWTFWMRGNEGSDASGMNFTANVGTWTGSAVGSVLWSSGPHLGTASATYQEFTFLTGGLSLLTDGTQYIFFLDYVSGDGEMQMGGFGGEYASGAFAYHNGTDHLSSWTSYNNADAVFRAEFDRVPGGPGSTVPEPATMTLLATGLAGMAATRKRKLKS